MYIYIYIYMYIYILNLYKGKLRFKENAENTFRSDVLIAINKNCKTQIPLTSHSTNNKNLTGPTVSHCSF